MKSCVRTVTHLHSKIHEKFLDKPVQINDDHHYEINHLWCLLFSYCPSTAILPVWPHCANARQKGC